jgi:hypothetical protein
VRVCVCFCGYIRRISGSRRSRLGASELAGSTLENHEMKKNGGHVGGPCGQVGGAYGTGMKSRRGLWYRYEKWAGLKVPV